MYKLFNFKTCEVGDFHIHSVHSDGMATPEEIVKMASSCFIKNIAITDHDTIDGISEARKFGRKYGVTVIPGMELSTTFKDKELHILAYGFNYESESVKSWMKKLKEARWIRLKKMISKLEFMGITISESNIIEEFGGHSSLPCRPHLARAMQKHGVVESVKEAFDKYIGNSSPAYVSFEEKLSTFEAVKFIKENNGIAILAHPFSSNVDEVLDEILKTGIDGIEVFHPSCSSENRDILLNFCSKNNLIVTGGSDTHDRYSIGTVRVDCKIVTQIVDEIKKRKGLI